jgi:Trk-type K+ transport system membrane component
MPLSFNSKVSSESTNGLAILVTATESPGTLLHRVVATTTDSREEVRLVLYNNSTATQLVMIEWGATEIWNRIPVNVQAQAAPGPAMFLNLSATTTTVRAYSTGTATEAIRAWLQVNRAT